MIPDCPLATKFFSEWLIALELTVAIANWKNMDMPTNIGDAYSTHRMLYEAMRMDFSKGIAPPEMHFANVLEASEESVVHKLSGAFILRVDYRRWIQARPHLHRVW